MRPRLISRGKQGGREKAIRRGRCFNEAATDQSRKVNNPPEGDDGCCGGCFNEAATDQSRKGDRGRKQRYGRIASMRPRLISRGKRSFFSAPSGASSGFNEAATDQSRKAARGRAGAAGVRAASMRPRLISRGKSAQIGCNTKKESCFNEAATDQSRKAAIQPPTGEENSGFNEAATDQSRKEHTEAGTSAQPSSFNEAATDQSRKGHRAGISQQAGNLASMRPRLISRGKSVS